MASTVQEALTLANGPAMCTIDLYSRSITIPATVSVLGVVSDDDVFRLWFSMPKMFGEIDLSTFDIRINYLNANNEGDIYEVTDAAVDGDNLVFSWLIGRSACTYQGSVKFIACFKISDIEGNVTQEFNTAVATLPVLSGIEPGSQIVEQYPDIIESILQRLDTDEGNVSTDTTAITNLNKRMLDTISGVQVNENTGSMELWSKDLNTVVTSGFYNAITCQNAKYNYGTLLVIAYYLEGYCTQINFDATTAGKMAIRSQINGSWSAWVEK